MKILILGGTTEGRALATACADVPGFSTVSSLAGRTSDPRLPPGPVRIGGLGGVAGLTDHWCKAAVRTAKYLQRAPFGRALPLPDQGAIMGFKF